MPTDTSRQQLSNELIEKFTSIPTAVLSDVTDSERVIVDPQIKPIWDIPRTVGRAITVEAPPNDNYSIHVGLDRCNKGDLLVIDADSYTKSAVWGEITSIASLEKGVEGTVIDGAVRDVAEIKSIEYPVCAREINPTTTHKRLSGKINEPILCGEVRVTPGDVVVCDSDGVAIIPQTIAERILEKAIEKINQEEKIINRIKQGESTLDILM